MKTIIIANRLPIRIERKNKELIIKESEGGLATGLQSVCKNKNNIWIGWPGIVPKNQQEKDFINAELLKRNLIPVYLTEQEVKCFYEGFANEIIWPICHYRPSYTVYKKENWEFYEIVNKKFATTCMYFSTQADTIWVHDYHLMLLPYYIKKQNPKIKVGYFQHIPFPTHEIFKAIPWRKDLLEGILAADLVGFHTPKDKQYFMNTCKEILNYSHSNTHIFLENKQTKVDFFPMGIDANKFRSISEEQETRMRRFKIRQQFQYKTLILSVDRLDYSKGIIEKIQAIQLLLRAHPEYIEKIVFLQLLVPSRTSVPQYQKLKNTINRWISEVNSEFGTTKWQPIRYLYNSYPIEEVCALYSAADICLVTPLRDGMNLVCKEYIMCKSQEYATGVLNLSEMAGAALHMKETIQVNPNNIEEIKDALITAMQLSDEEQFKIIQTLKRKIENYDIHY